MLRASLLVVFSLVATLAACGPSHVTFESDHCFLDGRLASHDEVEKAQAEIAQRVVGRQPIYVIVTLAVVLLATASQWEKLWLLFAARRHGQEHTPLAERVRTILDRQRANPVRYFGIVSGTLLMLLVAGGAYLYLDADKRASERALGQLQFCHLAMESTEEQAKLDLGRQNIDALKTTVGDIKTLVDSLPPEEQRKAESLLGQMRVALGNQDKLLAKSNAVSQAVEARSTEIQKDLLLLKGTPDALVALDSLVKQVADNVKHVDTRLDATTKQLAAADDKLLAKSCAGERLPSGKTLGEAIAELAARPVVQAPACPACRCECATPSARDGGAR